MEPNTIQPDETQSKNPTPGKSSGSKKLPFYAGFIILLATVGAGIYFWQNSKTMSSQRDLSSLRAEKNSLARENQSLKDKNKNLTDSLEVLQGQPSEDMISP